MHKFLGGREPELKTFWGTSSFIKEEQGIMETFTPPRGTEGGLIVAFADERQNLIACCSVICCLILVEMLSNSAFNINKPPLVSFKINQFPVWFQSVFP